MRLIDADKFKRHFPHDEDWDYPVNTNSLVVELLEEEPTVEEHVPSVKVSYCWNCGAKMEEDNDVNVRG